MVQRSWNARVAALAGLVLLGAGPAYATPTRSEPEDMRPDPAITLPAGRLMLLTASGNAAYFLDLDRTRRAGDVVDAWTFEIFSPDSKVGDSQLVERVRVRCSARTAERTGGAFFFSGHPGFARKTAPETPIKERTPYAALATVACSDVPPTPAFLIVVGAEAAAARGLEAIAARDGPGWASPDAPR